MDTSLILKPLPSISFGEGSIVSLPDIAASFGSRLLIVTGSRFHTRSDQWPAIERKLLQNGASISYACIDSEPTAGDIDSIVSQYLPSNPDAVIAIGGGSVLDSGKAVSAMLTAGAGIEQYLEGVGNKQPSGQKIPFIAVPTTSGTGSEATANAVITKSGTDGYKKSLRHDRYVPDHALIDPSLMRSCPPSLTASCAMDTFTQLVEGFLSTRASSITDVLAMEGLKAVQKSLITVYENGNDIDARSDLAFATLCSGIVLANAGLGIIHGLAPPLGSLFSVPHGVVCGTLMASGNETTLARLLENSDGERTSLQPFIDKFESLDRLFGGDISNSGQAGNRFIEFLYRVTDKLNLPQLSQFGVTSDALDQIAAQASNKNNPVHLEARDIRAIMEKRL